MRRALILTALILLRLPAIALAAALAWVQTAPGKRQLVQLIETAAASPSLDVRIGRLDGFVPFDPPVVNLAAADGDRKRVVEGKSVSVRLHPVGRRLITNNTVMNFTLSHVLL